MRKLQLPNFTSSFADNRPKSLDGPVRGKSTRVPSAAITCAEMERSSNRRGLPIHRHYALPLLAVALAACQPNAETPGMTPLDACKRADVKNLILDEIATAFATRSGNPFAFVLDPNSVDGISERFKSRSTIENPRVSDVPLAGQKFYEIHCTVDLATVNSATDETPVELRNVEFTIHYNNGTADLGTEDYYLLPNKASFFRSIYMNGMPKAQYDAEQVQAAQLAEQARLAEQQAAQAAQDNAASASAAAEEAEVAATVAVDAQNKADGEANTAQGGDQR